MDPITEDTKSKQVVDSPLQASSSSQGGRKRLSRKEHKARKKQKKQHQKQEQKQPKQEKTAVKQPSKAGGTTPPVVKEQEVVLEQKTHKETAGVTGKKRKTVSLLSDEEEQKSQEKGKNQPKSDSSSPTITAKNKPSEAANKKKNKKKQKKKQSKGGVADTPENEQEQEQQQQQNKADLPTEGTTENSSKKSPQSTGVVVNTTPILLDKEEPYVATPIPTWTELHKSHGAKPLGKWFPKAVIVKAKEPPIANAKASLTLFYQYTDPLWPESVTEQLISYLLQIAETRVLGGRIRVAREGVNATLSSRDTSTSTAAATLRHVTRDLQSFHPIFASTDFKFIDQLSGDRHFKDFKIFPVKELVFYGLDEASAPLNKGGVHLSAEEFHSKLAQPETVVVDVRNHYEAAIGRFDGQMVQSSEAENKTDKDSDEKDEKEKAVKTATKGATYVDPKMRKSTDFAAWLQKPETTSQLAGKHVLLYCTGGVRCERASAYVNQTMGEKLAGVYQLQGGIERYLQAFPDGGFWRGKNFVFDKREAFDVNNPDGDGGVVRKQAVHKNNKKQDKDAATTTTTTTTTLPEMKCCVCQKPWDRYVGKKKCETCGVPVLMCDTCMSSNNNGEKKKQQQQQPKQFCLIRCPLCVEENVTVPANDVEWTDNGVTPVFSAGGSKKTKGQRQEKDKKETTTSKLTMQQEEIKKAAPSVLKWGGGHASQKKERRRFQHTPCRFGADCKRSDCFFAHPSSHSTGGDNILVQDE